MDTEISPRVRTSPPPTSCPPLIMLAAVAETEGTRARAAGWHVQCVWLAQLLHTARASASYGSLDCLIRLARLPHTARSIASYGSLDCFIWPTGTWQGQTFAAIVIFCGVIFLAMPLSTVGAIFNQVWQDRDLAKLQQKVREPAHRRAGPRPVFGAQMKQSGEPYETIGRAI